MEFIALERVDYINSREIVLLFQPSLFVSIIQTERDSGELLHYDMYVVVII